MTIQDQAGYEQHPILCAPAFELKTILTASKVPPVEGWQLAPFPSDQFKLAFEFGSGSSSQGSSDYIQRSQTINTIRSASDGWQNL
jgi:hypothetical protein